jgi:hypothetical protein
MYWSCWDEGKNLEMVRKAGFEVIEGKVEVEDEGVKRVKFLWVLARKEKEV